MIPGCMLSSLTLPKRDMGLGKSNSSRKRGSTISYNVNITSLLEFSTNPTQGLTDTMVTKNKDRFGSNVYKKKKTKSFFEILL